MKRHFICFFALSVLAGALLSCVKEGGIEIPDPETNPASYVVTVDEARTGVESLLADLDPPTRGSTRTISETIVKGGFGATRSGDAPEEPLYYIFNFENDEGFAMASGDSRTPPVFCLTDTGSFDAEALVENPSAAMTLISYDTDYRVTVGLPVAGPDGGWINPGEPGYPSGTGWAGVVTTIDDKLGTGYFDPGEPLTVVMEPWGITERSGSLIAAQWGQEIPYNNKLPIWKDTIRAVTGCSTTAVAQLLYHYGYPSSINGKTLDWNLMKRHIRYSDPPTILNHQPAHENIAILFQELVKSEYLDASFADSDEENSTGVNKSRVTKTLRKLGYNTNDVADYNLQAVMGTIRQGRPVLVRGNTHRTPIKFLGIILSYTYSGGHAWICDHLIVRTQVTKWYRGDELIKTYTQTQNLLHCNWGWDNRSNGYFLPSTRFNIAHMVHVDGTRAEGAEGNYQYNLEMWDQIRR